MKLDYIIDVDWNDDGDFSDTNENITANVKAGRLNRGRNYGSNIHGHSQAGKLQLTLDNPAGIYSPTNGSSPLAGDLLQGRTIRVRVGIDPTYTTRFTGRISSIIPRTDRRVDITALGMLDDLAYVKPRTTVFENLNTYELVQVVLDYSRKGWVEFIEPDAPVSVLRMNVPEVGLPTASPGSDYNIFPDAALNYAFAIVIVPPPANIGTEQVAEYRFGTARITRLLGEPNGFIQTWGGVNESGEVLDTIFEGTNPWSVEMWLELNEASATPKRVLLVGSVEPDPDDGIQLTIDTSGGTRRLTLIRRVAASTTGTATITNNTTVKIDTLMHVVATYDGTSTLSLYIDGALADDGADTTAMPDLVGVYFGSNGLTNAATLMALGPVAFYDYELTSTQVAAHAAYDFIGTELASVTSTEWTDVDAWWADGTKTGLQLLRDLENTEFGFFREKGDGTFVFEDKAYRLRETRSITSQETFSDVAPAALPYMSGAALEDQKLQIVNIAEATGHVIDSNEENEEILWELQAPMPTIGPGETKRFFATFNGDGYWRYRYTTDAGVIGPLETESLAFAALPLATGAVLFVQNTSESPVTLTHLRFHGQTWTRHSPVTMYEAKDPTSIATYKSERQYRNTTPWLYGPEKAQAYADMAVYLLKDPTPLVRLPFAANKTATQHTDLMALEISDRVTVTATEDRTLWGLDEDFFIEAIEEQFSAQGDYTITFVCSSAVKFGTNPTGGDTGFWVLGTSSLGVDTRLWFGVA